MTDLTLLDRARVLGLWMSLAEVGASESKSQGAVGWGALTSSVGFNLIGESVLTAGSFLLTKAGLGGLELSGETLLGFWMLLFRGTWLTASILNPSRANSFKLVSSGDPALLVLLASEFSVLSASLLPEKEMLRCLQLFTSFRIEVASPGTAWLLLGLDFWSSNLIWAHPFCFLSLVLFAEGAKNLEAKFLSAKFIFNLS